MLKTPTLQFSNILLSTLFSVEDTESFGACFIFVGAVQSIEQKYDTRELIQHLLFAFSNNLQVLYSTVTVWNARYFMYNQMYYIKRADIKPQKSKSITMKMY